MNGLTVSANRGDYLYVNISIGKCFSLGYHGYMSKQFRTCSLDQPLLLPPSLQDWLPEKHLARFIADVTEALDLSQILDEYARRDGRGMLGYHPGMLGYHPLMMVRVLLYGYCLGMVSSRKLERAT